MIYTKEVENMCPVAKGAKHEPAPIPEEGKWVHSKKIEDISGFTHGVQLRSCVCRMYSTMFCGRKGCPSGHWLELEVVLS